MKIIKEVLARIFALWALLWFFATMLIVFLPIWMIGLWPEPKRTIFLCNIFRVWMRVFFFITGLRLQKKGKEYFKKRETYIVVCNHNTLLDVPVSTPGIPGPNKTIAKIEISRIPVFGMMYKRGSVLVNRKSGESRKASYAKMKEVLELGIHMCIYPEGTRNKTNEPLQQFHDGAFKLAVDTGHSILPALIFNTSKIFPNNKTFYFWPSKIEMHFLEPIAVGSQNSDQLKEKTFNLMKEYYLQYHH
ncbi:MAG TPA: 1-acyl-sn-glycerol-3-phosphate acyltransferase [Chitinophagaceae bacterium]|nr:1-acyl-sn-glycerol-3-phosphate acyltransferase [Chitinophagaceae bacterium]